MAVLDPVLNDDDGVVARNKINDNDIALNTDIGTNAVAIATKATKIVPASPGNLAGLDAVGELQDSGVAVASVNSRSGVSGTLAAGAQKITFPSAFADNSYAITINCYDTSGVQSAFTRAAKDADGFNVVLSFQSIVEYNATKI
jgi:hypothetical protein